jgi:hypothetical protein
MRETGREVAIKKFKRANGEAMSYEAFEEFRYEAILVSGMLPFNRI